MLQLLKVLPACLFAALAACGGEQREREVMKPEETVFRDYVTAPGKVQDRVDAARDGHRDAIERQLEESEGGADAE